MEKEFKQIQLGLFFKSDFNDQFEKVSLLLKEKFGNELASQIIALPNNAPADLPRLTINSEILNINFAKNRIDFFSKDQNFVDKNIDKIFDILSNLSIIIGRVGIVLTFFKECKIEQYKSILNESKIQNLNINEINLRLNERKQINGIEINNSHAYVSASTIETQGTKKNGLAITIDVNTLVEDIRKNEFKKEQVQLFLDEANSKADNTIF